MSIAIWLLIEQYIGYVAGFAVLVLICWIDAKRQDPVQQAKRSRN